MLKLNAVSCPEAELSQETRIKRVVSKPYLDFMDSRCPSRPIQRLKGESCGMGSQPRGSRTLALQQGFFGLCCIEVSLVCWAGAACSLILVPVRAFPENHALALFGQSTCVRAVPHLLCPSPECPVPPCSHVCAQLTELAKVSDVVQTIRASSLKRRTITPFQWKF